MENIKWYLSNYAWVILGHILPTKAYLSLKYRVIFGRWIDWKNPKSYTEKLQWLKVYGYKPEYSTMVDKVQVKEYVRNILGDSYIIPTLATWKSVDDIDFSSLPASFVLKCNHDSGMAIVCKDIANFNEHDAKEKLSAAFSKNYYLMGRETPYKFVQRQILAEALLQRKDGGEIKDYKFLCFDGEPKIFKMDFGRSSVHHANFYDMDKNLLPFGMINCPPDPSVELDLPSNFDDMIEVVKKLCKGIPFVRIDLYNVDGQIYFGEITFYPSAGLVRFTDPEWDEKLGNMISL